MSIGPRGSPNSEAINLRAFTNGPEERRIDKEKNDGQKQE